MSFHNQRAIAEDNLKNAIQSLQKTISSVKTPYLDDFEFPTFDTIESAELGAKEIQAAIERLLDKRSQTKDSENDSVIRRFKGSAKKWFEKSYPFISLCLNIAKLGANVPALNPYGLLFGGLDVLLTIAFQECQRAEELERTLEVLFGTMHRIRLIKEVPADMGDAQVDDLQCKALVLCGAVLEFLELSILTLTSSFAKKFKRGVFTGSREFKAAEKRIEISVNQFNSTLGDLGTVATWETRTMVRNQRTMIEGLAVSIGDIHRKLDRKPSSDSADLLTEPVNQVFKFLSLSEGDWSWMTRYYGELIDALTKKELIDWIFPSDIHEIKHNSIVGKRVEGSGKWFLQHPDFTNWVHGNSSNLLYCPGDAGSGKTVITSLVIDELLEKMTSTDQSRGLAYVYIDYKYQIQQSTSSIVSCFLKQLAVRLDSEQPEIQDLQKKFRIKSKRPELVDLMTTLDALLQRFTSTYVIFDALDECDTMERVKVLKVIEKFAEAGVKVFATCRPHIREVRHFFESRNAITIPIKANTQDIKNFLGIRVERTIQSTSMKAKIANQLSLHAKGVFLLAEAQLNYVLRFTDPRNMREALENSVIPTELFEVYETVMDTINRRNDDSQKLAKNILSWLFYAKRPLQMAELREAIAVREGDCALCEDDLLTPDGIVEVCQSLVRHDSGSGIVSFYHEVVQDFLRQRYSQWLLPESEIARTCVQYLNFDIFNLGMCSDEKSFKQRLEKSPFAYYAARHWGFHVEGGNLQDDVPIQQRLVEIWKSRTRANAIAQILWSKKDPSLWQLHELSQNETVLHAIAYYNLPVLAKNILVSDAGLVTAETVGGASPLNPAVNNGNIGVIKVLLESNDGLVDRATRQGLIPLHFAAYKGHPHVVDTFLQSAASRKSLESSGPGGSNVDCQTNDGWTALHVACEFGHLDVIERLVAFHANINIQTTRPTHMTPLYVASRNGHLKAVETLLDAGADSTITDQFGNTPFSVALSRNEVEVAKLLLLHANTRLFNIDHGSELVGKTTPMLRPEDVEGLSRVQLASCMLKLSPKEPEAHKTLAYYYFVEGKYELALRAYELALTLDPRNASVSQMDAIFHFAFCDNCGVCAPIRGYRHKCKGCDDYDLCDECFKAIPHPHPEHKFLTIPSEQWVCERFKAKSDVPITAISEATARVSIH